MFLGDVPPDLVDFLRLPEPAAAGANDDLALIVLWNPYLPGLLRSELREATLATRDRWIRAAGIYDYWRSHGFPPQCRPAGDDGFSCD